MPPALPPALPPDEVPVGAPPPSQAQFYPQVPSPLDSAGTVAGPLLAGISFTLVVLVLQMPSKDLRWRDLALLLFVIAGLSMITMVQASMWERRYRGRGPDGAEGKKWDGYARHAYHAGILALFAAMTVLLVPKHSISNLRFFTIFVAFLGFLGEIGWIGLAVKRQSDVKRRSGSS
jgi:hypothetical protein